MRSPLALMLPLIEQPPSFRNTSAVILSPRRQSHGATNRPAPIPTFSADANPSCGVMSGEYSRYAIAQPSAPTQALRSNPCAWHTPTLRPDLSRPLGSHHTPPRP